MELSDVTAQTPSEDTAAGNLGKVLLEVQVTQGRYGLSMNLPSLDTPPMASDSLLRCFGNLHEEQSSIFMRFVSKREQLQKGGISKHFLKTGKTKSCFLQWPTRKCERFVHNMRSGRGVAQPTVLAGQCPGSNLQCHRNKTKPRAQGWSMCLACRRCISQTPARTFLLPQ